MWRIASYSDVGTRIVNEDRVCVTESGNCACVTVADGVGGHGGGSTAANAVTRKLNRLFAERVLGSQKAGEILEKNVMLDVLTEVNATVLNLQTAGCRLQATCVTVWMVREENCCTVRWAHTGDSRLYFFRKGKLCFRTKDHSLLESGAGNQGTGLQNIQRNVIWQAMGEPEGIRPDISDKIQIENEPAAFLLCSDGLWEGVEEDKMEKLLARSCTPEEWLENLRKELSMARLDAYDNNSAAAVFIR